MSLLIKDGAGSDKYLAGSGLGTQGDPFIPLGSVNDAGATRLPVYQFADTVGDGSGTTNMNVDGSITPVIFLVKPSVGEIYRIARIIVSVRDTGTIDSGGWGANGGSPLTNGLVANVKWNGSVIPLTVESIKSNIDLAAISYDISHNSWGSGDEFVVFRFTFTKAGQYIRLDGDLGDELQFVVNDDLTYLVQQRISVQGYRE